MEYNWMISLSVILGAQRRSHRRHTCVAGKDGNEQTFASVVLFGGDLEQLVTHHM